MHPAFSTRASEQKQTEYVCQKSRWQLLCISALLPIKWESRRYLKSFPTLKKYCFSFCVLQSYTPISERLTASIFDTNCLYDCPLRLIFCLLILEVSSLFSLVLASPCPLSHFSFSLAQSLILLEDIFQEILRTKSAREVKSWVPANLKMTLFYSDSQLLDWYQNSRLKCICASEFSKHFSMVLLRPVLLLTHQLLFPILVSLCVSAFLPKSFKIFSLFPKYWKMHCGVF